MTLSNGVERKLDRIAKNVKNLLYLIGVIVAICTSVYITIDRTFESKVHELNASLDSRISAVELYTTDQIVKNIIKQADKIKDDPTDIKMADIEDALKYYPMIKEPTAKVELAYKLIMDWYINNQ